MRAIPEWIAKHDNQAIPDRVRLRIFVKHNGICPKCTRKLVPNYWDCDHIVALINGGQHRESNLQPLCVSPCHSNKTALDLKEKSKVYHAAAKNAGINLRKGPPMPGSKASGLRKRMDGTVERR